MPDDVTPVEAAAVVEMPVVRITSPMPLDLAAALYRGIADACEELGYEAFCKQEDGLSVVWARRRDTS